MSSPIRRLALALLLALLASPLAAASARLHGTVVGPDQTPIAGVTITVTSEELASFRTVETSDEDGEFRVTFQQSRFLYRLLFEKVGFQSFTQEVQPTATQRMQETFVMEPAAARVEERHGTLTAVVTGTSNAAVTAYNAGLDAQKAEDLATARARFAEAIVADPTLAPAHAALARVLLDAKEYEAAAAAAATALELRPNDVDTLRVRYESLRAAGRRDEAEALTAQLAAAEDAVETARRRYHEGAEAFQAGDEATALARFEEAAKLDPGLQDAHHAVATLRLGQGDYEGAAAAAEAALELGSDDVRTLRVLYDAYEALGRTDDLVEIAPRLAAVDPEFGGPKLLEQGTALFNAGQGDAAVPVLELALATDPTLAKAHYMLGLHFISAGESAKAREHLERFLAMAPDDPEAAGAREMLAYLD